MTDISAYKLESHLADIARSRNLPTISAVARAAGLERSTVRRLWGRRTPHYFKLSTICKLCQALNVQPGELLVMSKNGVPIKARLQASNESPAPGDQPSSVPAQPALLDPIHAEIAKIYASLLPDTEPFTKSLEGEIEH